MQEPIVSKFVLAIGQMRSTFYLCIRLTFISALEPKK